MSPYDVHLVREVRKDSSSEYQKMHSFDKDPFVRLKCSWLDGSKIRSFFRFTCCIATIRLDVEILVSLTIFDCTLVLFSVFVTFIYLYYWGSNLSEISLKYSSILSNGWSLSEDEDVSVFVRRFSSWTNEGKRLMVDSLKSQHVESTIFVNSE